MWSKFFLCRGDADGENLQVLFELSRQELATPGNVNYGGPTVWWPSVMAFDVSWTEKKAAILVNRWRENVVTIGLEDGARKTYTIGDPKASGFSGIWGFSFEVPGGGSQILWSMFGCILGTLTFDGTTKYVDIGRETNFEWGFGKPAWSEEQHLVAVEARPRSLRNEVWIYSSDLVRIDRFSVADLAPVLHAKQEHKQPPEHRYAWVVDKLWAAYLPSGSNNTRLSSIDFYGGLGYAARHERQATP